MVINITVAHFKREFFFATQLKGKIYQFLFDGRFCIRLSYPYTLISTIGIQIHPRKSTPGALLVLLGISHMEISHLQWVF